MSETLSAAKAPPRTTITVGLNERAYPIAIGAGLLTTAGAEIAAVMPGAKAAIVTDETVAGLHLETLKASLDAAGVRHGEIVLPPGEATKSFGKLEVLSEGLLELGIERRDVVVAFGGGVIGDLAGFAASILRRGVALIQIPTTLLAQVDSSVGGKTGINTRQGKNLIGTFYQPRLVLADTDVLETLSPRQFRAGYAEVAKYGLLGDAAFFNWLEANWRDVFAGPGPARTHAIETSCRAKAAIVAADEREAGERALLNLGHTFGHALEAFAGFSDRLLHGEAVAIGMVMAFRYSAENGLIGQAGATRVARHLAAVGLPTSVAGIPGEPPAPDRLMQLMAQDKKVTGGVPAFILVRGIGSAYIERDMDMETLGRFIARDCGTAAA